MFLARYDSAGNCLGVKTVTNISGGFGLSTNPAGSVIISGFFNDSTDFDTFHLVSRGESDIFLAKMSPITGMSPLKTHNADQLIIYANPSAGNCSIMVPDDFLHESGLVLSIYDIKGRLMHQQTLDMNTPKVTLDMEFEAKGTYIATLSNGVKVYTGKIVFE